jgi:hypothetical protein
MATALKPNPIKEAFPRQSPTMTEPANRVPPRDAALVVSVQVYANLAGCQYTWVSDRKAMAKWDLWRGTSALSALREEPAEEQTGVIDHRSKQRGIGRVKGSPKYQPPIFR